MIKVNQDLCVGCGLCVNTCPDTFKLNNTGKSEVISQDNISCAQTAIASCPVQAISIE